MAGWASTPWATYWAGGAVPAPALVSARPVRTNVLRVRFNIVPRALRLRPAAVGRRTPLHALQP